MKFNQSLLHSIPSLLTLGLFGVASFYPVTSLFGVSHLSFLSDGLVYLYVILAAAAVYAAAGPVPRRPMDRVADALDSLLWGGRRWPKAVVAVVFMVAFYVFRSQVHLLGDGYAWLDIFGQGRGYIHKWTEPGSTYLIRWLQQLLGGYSSEDARMAFQLLSILSGAVFVYNAISVVGTLVAGSYTRLLGLVTLVFSGSLLLFFGYVEFYPVTWATSMLFLNLSLRFINGETPWWAVALSYLPALAMHVQVLCFLPALLYLFAGRIPSPVAKKTAYVLLATAIVAGAAVLVWLSHSRIDVEVLLLPLFEGRPVAPDYTLFSGRHFLDLFNLVLLVFPGGLVLLALFISTRKKALKDGISLYLAFLSLGSVAFVFLFGAAITMGRDWDIMSLGLLPPCLLMLYHIGRRTVLPGPRVLLTYSIVVVFMTCSFIAVSIQTKPAEDRYFTLLSDRNRNAWMLFGQYFRRKGELTRRDEITKQVHERFPDYILFKSLASRVEKGEFDGVFKAAEQLVRNDPYDPDYLRFLAGLCVRSGQSRRAEELFRDAVLLKPYDPELMEEAANLLMKFNKLDEASRLLENASALAPENSSISESLGLVYINQNRLDDAAKVAAGMFSLDPDSPGGHLIMIVVSLGRSRPGDARHYYLEYLEHGKDRAGYEQIRKTYEGLLR
ncbi:MAG: hypothetical protein JSW34_09070 [Candidatus Zixiibacteriota bacterium]|nr:MAG: hypothetical protein JSW34_09070 [candidate division Zixibacteria bacterium]